jgi:exoribonuclease II
MTTPNTIIEFSASSGARIGLVTGAVGAKKLIVMTSEGQEMRPEIGAVTFSLGSFKADAGPDAVRAKLASVEAAVDAAQAEVELELVWEMLSELGEAMSAHQIADLVFGDTTHIRVLGTLRSLRADKQYFKQKKDVFEPRPADLVNQLKSAQEAEQRRAEERGHFLDSIADVLAKPPVERGPAARALTAGEHFRQTIQLLQDYATTGEDYEKEELANNILDAIERRTEQELRGNKHMRAFTLMVQLGLWDEHENIWLHRYHINTGFRDDVVTQATELAEQPWDPTSEPWRKDLTRLLTFSIDDITTLDIDDALSCSPRIEGGWSVGIHIADPGAIVTNNSPLDLEARSRGTSVYLPTGHIPMFPLTLSEGRMSLFAGQLRPSMTTQVEFNEDLEIESWEIFPSMIKSGHRLTYDQVDEMLEQDPKTQLHIALQDIAYLASELFQNRISDGATSFSIPEVKIKVDFSNGAPEVTCEPVDNDTPSRTLVSEMMILANGLMARFCHKNEIPTIYRAQDPPEGPLIDEQILALPEGLPRTFAILRRMKRGDITTKPSQHFGLGLPMYVQATSPIRRYSDLFCQRQVSAFLRGVPMPYGEEELMKVAATVENTTREAMLTERETKRYWTLHYLQSLQGEQIEGMVTGYQQPDNTRADVFLTQCAFRVPVNLKKRIPLGERITLTVVRADPRNDFVQLREAND